MPSLREIVINDYLGYANMAQEIGRVTGRYINQGTVKAFVEGRGQNPTLKTLMVIAATVQHRGYAITEVPEIWNAFERRYPDGIDGDVLGRLEAGLDRLVKVKE